MLSLTVFVWRGHQDSNPGPTVLETVALPTELYPHETAFTENRAWAHARGVRTKKEYTKRKAVAPPIATRREFACHAGPDTNPTISLWYAFGQEHAPHGRST